MSTAGRASSVRSRLRKYGFPLIAAAAIAGGMLAFTGGRVEAITCSLLADKTLLINSPAESAIVISHDAPGLLGDSVIRVNGIACGTFNTVFTIKMTGSTGSEQAKIVQSNGPFVQGTREITFTGDLGAGSNADFLTIIGQGVADNAAFGTSGTQVKATLNGNNTLELAIAGVEKVFFEGQGGNDVVTGLGKPSIGLSALTLPFDIKGADGADVLTGGNANDSLNGGSADDVLNGAAGTDTLTYAGETMPVLVDFGAGTAIGELIGNDAFSNVEIAVGGSSNDTFIDNPIRCDNAIGGGGNDTFVALNRPGEDCGNGEVGDSFNGQTGEDTYDGTAAPANSPGISFDFINKIVHGSGEDDCIDCENGEGTEAGDDEFIDDPNECNVFNGNGDNDTFIAVNRPGTEEGGTCGDTFDGGAGTDTYDATDVPANSPGVSFDFVNKIVHGSGEDDCIDCENGEGTEQGGDEFIDDPTTCNVFNGNGDDDTFFAKNRPGTEEGGTCGDTFDGGEAGETNGDTYDANDVPANSPGVSFDFINKIVHGSGEDDCINCEVGGGSEAGGDTFIDEDNSCNRFFGRGGDDLFIAGFQPPGQENDPSKAAPCGDFVELGETDEEQGDSLDYGRTTSGVIMDIPNGTVGHPDDVGREAENLFGTEFDDTLIGDEGDNTLHGRGGNDTIVTNGGNDDADGGEGNDTIDGEPEAGEVGIYCNLSTGVLIVDGQTTNGVTSCPEGTARDDTFIGNDAANTFNGNGGNDRLEGRGGNDTLNGGNGDDEIFGGNGNDTINGGDGNDTIDGGNGDDHLSGGSGDDTMRGGSNGNDVIDGGEGNDNLFGDNGNDTIDGGPGFDTVDGGSGSDSCVNGESVTNCES